MDQHKRLDRDITYNQPTIISMTSKLPSTGNMDSLVVKQESLSCYEALSEMVHSFQDSDIRNFLFTREPIEQPYFNNPTFSQTAVTAKSSSKRSYEQVVEQVQGYMVYIPAFNISKRNLGFGYHYHYDNGSVTHSSARFVHEDSKRTFTTVLQSDERVIIMYKKYVSTTCHKRFIACFEKEVFLGLVDSFNECTNLINTDRLMGAVKQMVVGIEFRDCAYCGHRDCNCDFAFVAVKHPFDNSAFREGVTMLMGSFKGFARVESYENGETTVQKGESVIEVHEVFDEHVTEQLRRWGCDNGGGPREDVWTRNSDGGLILNVMREGREDENVVRELKAALRRERNRASARKSNMKKKKFNDGLKAAVSEERRRLERLRGRELVLRQRNLELRRLLALQGES